MKVLVSSLLLLVAGSTQAFVGVAPNGGNRVLSLFDDATEQQEGGAEEEAAAVLMDPKGNRIIPQLSTTYDKITTYDNDNLIIQGEDTKLTTVTRYKNEAMNRMFRYKMRELMFDTRWNKEEEEKRVRIEKIRAEREAKREAEEGPKQSEYEIALAQQEYLKKVEEDYQEERAGPNAGRKGFGR
mmetsp:Transcript_19090/g.21841  ORF Transcript_19090/g.21841 Transcript_19090/m.21841 type:complete len:184 (+) Transcript_19090:259-810(+)|eukprot:CAMPEP_0194131958 /NCGR_PEP_ID=MMETSP0152-20130528/2555_1 /TAXON_ID=1049557 /ORGANISM="Thalassiothrix antarctica, Strain L6-D1" /LENGTH=183 /DNA_ID=CAMNT_0038826857 /DNA_START=197 /DNA_END=748 /DNA_ORIENTATION=+